MKYLINVSNKKSGNFECHPAMTRLNAIRIITSFVSEEIERFGEVQIEVKLRKEVN